VSEPTIPVGGGLCLAWIVAADLSPGSVAKLTGVDAGDIDRALQISSEIMWALTGRRWSGGQCVRWVVAREVPPSELKSGWIWHRWTFGTDLLDAPGMTPQHPAQVMPIILPDYPVTAITQVTVDGDILAATYYRLDNGRQLVRTTSLGTPSLWTAEEVDIQYTYGIAPPSGGAWAAEVLGVEIALAIAGSDTCRLPERVTAITRQGVTMAMLDPQEFLGRGLTGLSEVDLWISAVNPQKIGSRPTVWSPDTARHRFRFLPPGD
jgi:hypothetical protein